MSIASQELLKAIAPASDLTEFSGEEEIPEGDFQKLMQVQPADDSPRERDLFSLFKKEEEEEDSISPEETPVATPCPLLSPLFALAPEEEKQDLSDPNSWGIPPLPPCMSAPVLLQGSTPVFHETRGSPLPPVIEAAFETMATTMILMSSTHETETTLFLDNPQFSSSALFGTKITIREFSTAPKIFNIEIASSPQGTALMEAGRGSLLQAFENAQFNFRVHRFETQIVHNEKGPVFHRKEQGTGDRQDGKQDEKGGRRQ